MCFNVVTGVVNEMALEQIVTFPRTNCNMRKISLGVGKALGKWPPMETVSVDSPLIVHVSNPFSYMERF